MNSEQVATVLARVQVGDNRVVDELVLADWEDTIGDLPFDAAIEAVRMHRRDSTAYLTAAHVRANVKVIQARWERDARIQQQHLRRALPAPKVTLERAEFDRLTQEFIEQYRKERAQ